MIQQPEPAPARRFFDLTLPLPFILASTVSMVLGIYWVGGQFAVTTQKLEQLIVSVDKIEKRNEARDLRVDSLRDTLATIQLMNAKLDIRVSAVERDKK